MVNIETSTITELKALLCDNLLQRDQANNNIAILQKEIQKKLQEKAKLDADQDKFVAENPVV